MARPQVGVLPGANPGASAPGDAASKGTAGHESALDDHRHAREAAGVATLNNQTASYTLVLADAGKLVEVNNASANTLTVPPNSSVAFAVGTTILFVQQGAGQTTLTPGSGVTLRSRGAALKTFGQYAMGTLVKRGTDEWYVSGDLTA